MNDFYRLTQKQSENRVIFVEISSGFFTKTILPSYMNDPDTEMKLSKTGYELTYVSTGIPYDTHLIPDHIINSKFKFMIYEKQFFAQN